MSTQNRWYKARFETTGAKCDIVVNSPMIAADDADGQAFIPAGVGRLALSDGRQLSRISRGRYLTHEGQIVISTDPSAP